jgi:hypothetical protein
MLFLKMLGLAPVKLAFTVLNAGPGVVGLKYNVLL